MGDSLYRRLDRVEREAAEKRSGRLRVSCACEALPGPRGLEFGVKSNEHSSGW